MSKGAGVPIPSRAPGRNFELFASSNRSGKRVFAPSSFSVISSKTRADDNPIFSSWMRKRVFFCPATFSLQALRCSASPSKSPSYRRQQLRRTSHVYAWRNSSLLLMLDVTDGVLERGTQPGHPGSDRGHYCTEHARVHFSISGTCRAYLTLLSQTPSFPTRYLFVLITIGTNERSCASSDTRHGDYRTSTEAVAPDGSDRMVITNAPLSFTLLG